MPYLNIDLDYFTHPKTMRLTAILGQGAAEFPIRLWAYCAKHHTEAGKLIDYTETEVESAAGWMGETGKLVAAMLKLNFLEKIDNGYRIHDWLDHAGHLAAFKKRAKSAAKGRWRRIASSNASSNLKSEITNTPILPILPNLIKKRNKIRYPLDFTVSENLMDLAREKGWSDPNSEIEAFKDHHVAKDSRFLDWEAAFRTWLRNDKKFNRGHDRNVQPEGELSERTKRILRRGL